MPDSPDLSGRTIGITADRRGEDQAVMFRRLGAEVVHGPTMATTTAPDDETLAAVTRAMIDQPPDFLIANTGMGIRMWMAKAAEWDLEAPLKSALAATRIASRGPKASGALSSAGLDIWWRAPGEQLAEVVDHLEEVGLAGRRVVLQLHGDDGAGFVRRLQQAQAEVTTLPVYEWKGPADLEAANHLIDEICADRIDAVTFTAGPQVRGLLELADTRDLAGTVQSRLNDRTIVGCIGPVCADVAREEGLQNLVVPDHWRLGSLVKVVAGALARP